MSINKLAKIEKEIDALLVKDLIDSNNKYVPAAFIEGNNSAIQAARERVHRVLSRKP